MSAPIKKRKAENFEDDADFNGSSSHSSSAEPASAPNQVQLPAQDLIDPQGVPFAIECPWRPNKKRKTAGNADVFGPADEDGGFKNLAIQYTIRPGSKWTEMKGYRNFIVVEQKFTIGSIVYINKNDPPVRPPPPEASEKELLEWDKDNLWVAKVLEVRATDPSHVFLRVFWLYWPDELPNGRQKYHGDNELVMSNAMEIVDAMCVTAEAEVKQWDENNDEQEDLGPVFFRQFLDTSVKGEPMLSELRRHCVCNEYYQPDKTMYKCSTAGCGIWNHEECLVDDVLEKTYEKHVTSQLPNGEKAVSPAARLKMKGSKTASKARKAGAGTKRPWAGMFSAVIRNNESLEGGLQVLIEETSKPSASWTESVPCLKCGEALD